MRIVFMGTPKPAAVVLDELIKSSQKIIAVVTQPGKPKGRGQKVQASAVEELALKNNIPVQSPAKANDPEFISYLKKLAPDLIVVVAYGKILPKEILDIPKHGCINVHASLLPKYRGAAPIQYAILAGEKKTGITIMKIDQGLDTGDIILQKEISIQADDTTETMFPKLFKLGSQALLEAIKLIETGKAQFEKQDNSKATHALSIKKQEGLIDWKKSAENINNQIRALVGWPSAYTSYNGKSLKIWKAVIFNSHQSPVTRGQDKENSGEVLAIEKGVGFVVSCGAGCLLIKEVQPENSKRMSAYDFVIGQRIKPGDKLGK